MSRLNSSSFAAIVGLLLVGCCVACKPQSPPLALRANRCASIDAANRALLSGPASLAGNPMSEALRQALQAATVCRETARGAWGIELSELKTEANETVGRWLLVHVSAEGVRSSVTPDTSMALGRSPPGPEANAKAANLEWSEYRKVVPALPTVFDYDHDLEFEAIVIVNTIDTHESGASFTMRRGRVWSAPANAIALYPAAQALIVEEARDVDADQRPDLLTHGPFAGLSSIKCGSEDSYPVYGPMLLAHSLSPGGFALSDSVSTAFAKQECPASPKPLVVFQTGDAAFVDFVVTAKNVACSTLWGTPSSSMATEISKRCLERDPCPTCDDAALLTRWAAVSPPLHLGGGSDEGMLPGVKLEIPSAKSPSVVDNPNPLAR
ncbi:MAG: hypothetical protein ABIQ16_15255 [Polyangiaceae bacterium]